jgi:hypothetical protein
MEILKEVTGGVKRIQTLGAKNQRKSAFSLVYLDLRGSFWFDLAF